MLVSKGNHSFETRKHSTCLAENRKKSISFKVGHLVFKYIGDNRNALGFKVCLKGTSKNPYLGTVKK